eukprot:3092374-Rhodomonas_salina.2
MSAVEKACADLTQNQRSTPRHNTPAPPPPPPPALPHAPRNQTHFPPSQYDEYAEHTNCAAAERRHQAAAAAKAGTKMEVESGAVAPRLGPRVVAAATHVWWLQVRVVWSRVDVMIRNESLQQVRTRQDSGCPWKRSVETVE